MRTVLLPLLLLFLAGPAAVHAQDDTQSLTEAKRLLDARNRHSMHPSPEPQTVVGREAGDNDLRSRTPALMRGDGQPAQMDREAAYARAVALYEGGEAFHSPPQRVVEPREPRGDRARSTSPSAGPDSSQTAPWWRSTLPSLAVGLLVVFLVYRRLGGGRTG